MAYIKLKSLRSCKCGGRPTITQSSGWWHIECKKCGSYPYEKLGCTRVYGWMSRNDAIRAWETPGVRLEPESVE